MIRLHRNPGATAQRIIDAIEGGEVMTSGQWLDVIAHLHVFPPRVRSWTLDRIRTILGDMAADYLESQVALRSSPVPKGDC
jgi:hypothetical protein